MAILLVFAHPVEAVSTIQFLKAKLIDNGYYQFDHGFLIITGMGMHATSIAMIKTVHQASQIWNLGFAGALNPSYELGVIKKIGSIDKFCLLPENLDEGSLKITQSIYPTYGHNNLGAKLITSDFPIHDSSLKNELQKRWDLVDMEGYSIAMLATAFQKPYQLWKIVSDFSSEGGRQILLDNKDYFSEMLAKQIENLLCLA